MEVDAGSAIVLLDPPAGLEPPRDSHELRELLEPRGIFRYGQLRAAEAVLRADDVVEVTGAAEPTEVPDGYRSRKRGVRLTERAGGELEIRLAPRS